MEDQIARVEAFCLLVLAEITMLETELRTNAAAKRVRDAIDLVRQH